MVWWWYFKGKAKTECFVSDSAKLKDRIQNACYTPAQRWKSQRGRSLPPSTSSRLYIVNVAKTVVSGCLSWIYSFWTESVSVDVWLWIFPIWLCIVMSLYILWIVLKPVVFLVLKISSLSQESPIKFTSITELPLNSKPTNPHHQFTISSTFSRFVFWLCFLRTFFQFQTDQSRGWSSSSFFTF